MKPEQLRVRACSDPSAVGVLDMQQTVSTDSQVMQQGRGKPLACHRLDGIPPDFLDDHRENSSEPSLGLVTPASGAGVAESPDQESIDNLTRYATCYSRHIEAAAATFSS